MHCSSDLEENEWYFFAKYIITTAEEGQEIASEKLDVIAPKIKSTLSKHFVCFTKLG